MSRDELGEFLTAYEEYLAGERPYDSLPVLGGGGERMGGSRNVADELRELSAGARSRSIAKAEAEAQRHRESIVRDVLAAAREAATNDGYRDAGLVIGPPSVHGALVTADEILQRVREDLEAEGLKVRIIPYDDGRSNLGKLQVRVSW